MKCETCGNEYDKPLRIFQNGTAHTFDCFECAIAKLAPECHHCHTRIIGHGMERGGEMYCCAHCANASGIQLFIDRV